MTFKVVSPKDKYKDDEIYEDIVKYCLNDKKTPHKYVVCSNVAPTTIGKDMFELAKRFNKLKGTRIRHMLFAFDPKEEAYIDCEHAYLIARDVCRFYARDYQIFAVVHETSDHVHIHVVMNTVRIQDGEKYKGRKKDYYAFQTHLRKIIRSYGLKLKVRSDT